MSRSTPITRVYAAMLIAVIGLLLLPPAASAEAIPAVTDVSARRGPTAGGNIVQISGSGLSGATGVRFGASTPATSFTVDSDQVIHAVVPAHPAGLVNVFVDTPGGTNLSQPSSWYQYLAPPVVSSVSPAAGPKAGGNQVTINGFGLRYTTRVRFGTNNGNSTFSVVDDTKVVATVPLNASGDLVNIWVDTPGGTNANKPSSWYRLVPPPSVTDVEPNRGPTAGGNTVVITGGPFTNIVGVYFNSSATPALSFTIDSESQITATAPPRSAGLICVKVESAVGGVSPNSYGCWYVYE